MSPWAGGESRSPERAGSAARRFLLAACAAAVACGGEAAAELRGSLAADRNLAGIGGTVRLSLTVSGEAPLPEIDQPSLPPFSHFALLATAQRNEATFGAGEAVHAETFIYTLRASSPGEEIVPPIEVTYRAKEGAEGGRLTVPGLTLTVERGGRDLRRVAAALLAACAAVAAAAILGRMRVARRRRAARRGPAEARTGAAAAAAAPGSRMPATSGRKGSGVRTARAFSKPWRSMPRANRPPSARRPRPSSARSASGPATPATPMPRGGSRPACGRSSFS